MTVHNGSMYSSSVTFGVRLRAVSLRMNVVAYIDAHGPEPSVAELAMMPWTGRGTQPHPRVPGLLARIGDEVIPHVFGRPVQALHEAAGDHAVIVAS